jgi:hypothetical protein
MGTGQMLLTVMATMILGRIILGINSSTLMTGVTKDMAEYRITATSLGTSMLETASSLAYDQASVAADLSTTTSLTAATALGKESGETTINTFNDVDDLNNFVKYDTLQNSAWFKTSVKVEYIGITSGTITVLSTQSWNKRVTVTMTSPFMEDTLRFQSIFSYWFFR